MAGGAATMMGHAGAIRHGPVVLVVEDDPLVRALIVERFDDAGLVVIEADDAEWAISILESNAAFVQVLFTDIALPGAIDGVSLALQVLKRWPLIAVAMTSGKFAPDDLPDGVRFFAKPIAAAQVVEQIRAMAAVGIAPSSPASAHASSAQ